VSANPYKVMANNLGHALIHVSSKRPNVRVIAMPDPREHAENRGKIESILQSIPGFRGYLRRENRREADELQREWLADRLQRSKRGLDEFARALADSARLDELGQLDRVRIKLDKLLSRIRGAMQGYSGFFDLVDINEAVLDRVYAHDVALMEQSASLADEIENLRSRTESPQTLLAPIVVKIESLEDAWDQREDILKGLE
jgi:hypothetical protein